MDHITQTCNVLNRMVRQGGIVPESALPQGDLLTMVRLTNQDFIKPCGTFLDTGELLFGITEKGVAEAERHDRSRGN